VRRGFAIGAGLAAMLAACTFLNPLGTDLTGGAGDDAGADAPIAAEASVVDSGSDGGGADDAGGDAAVDAGCASGELAKPLRAFDATEADAAATSTTCNADGVLVQGDSQVAGLDRNGGNYAKIDDVAVTACVGVELAAGTDVAKVVVTASSVDKACNYACDASGACGTGDRFKLFVGTTLDALVAIADVDVAPTLATSELVPPATAPKPARFLVACRVTYGAERDDIAIDFLTARCR
jgi:hypothetical protein